MLKQNKTRLIVSIILILLPMAVGLIFWQQLPDTMTIHWGADGRADGFSPKAFAVFVLPVILLGLHALCLAFTLLDKKQQGQNPKILRVVFWIVPVISLLACGFMYAAAWGKSFSLALIMPLLLGLLFIVMGNYLPKTKQNSTLGIKLSWTLNNEENWNRTHRLAGKTWVIGGVIMLLCSLLPIKVMVLMTVAGIVPLMAVPMGYSYWLYRQHQKQGIVYEAAPKSKAEKAFSKGGAIVGVIIVLCVGVFMFTGNLKLQWGEERFTIEADYWADMELSYEKIDSVEYREELDVGVRTGGLGTARLSVGMFENEEFGSYTLYAYTHAESYVVLGFKGNILVIGMEKEEDSYAAYEKLIDSMER